MKISKLCERFNLTIGITLSIFFSNSVLKAQDTFSIVAVDSVTGEVGSAGASCVDMFNLPQYATDFICDNIPGIGVITTQAAYQPGNQTNARARMIAGDTPSQIIAWLIANDVQSNPGIRQYGIAAFVNGSPETAAHTGANCTDYKNHITGAYYSIQGNILLGQQVLDSMQSRFLNEPGDLACKLMAALQGAKMVGADNRCTTDGTSSLFAFVKVSQPADPYGSPSFLVSVKTHDNSGIEPIDTLQTIFDAAHTCGPAGLQESDAGNDFVNVYPNPTTHSLIVSFKEKPGKERKCVIRDAEGKAIFNKKIPSGYNVDMKSWKSGVYFVEVGEGKNISHHKILKP